jgi:DNA-binding MarR family transcriptional regulator
MSMRRANRLYRITIHCNQDCQDCSRRFAGSMPARRSLTKAQYETLAALRHTLSQFLLFSQDAARTAGLAPQQHQALLAIKGFPGRDFVSIGELAGCLHLRHHSAVGLVDRLVHKGLARRAASAKDRRRVEVSLTTRGESLISRLSEAHWREIKQVGPDFRRVLDAITETDPAHGSALHK